MPVEHNAVSLDQRLRAFLEGTAATTGEAFFRAMVRHLAQALDVTHAFVTQCADDQRTRLRTVAFWCVDDYGANFEYDVAGTPCEAVMKGEAAFHKDDVQALFPTDTDLRALGARSYVAVPVHDAAGTVVGHLGALHQKPMPENRDHWILRVFATRTGAEIERLRAEQQLREAETELRRVLDAVPDLIWSGEITTAGVVQLRWASPALEQLTGRPPTFLEGEQLPWLAVVHPADRRRVKELADRLISGERDRSNHEYRIVRPDGTVRWVRDSAIVTGGGDGPRRIQGVISDITEWKTLSEQLLHAKGLESVGQLAAGVAHNFNNALATISGYSDLLSRRFPKGDPALEDIEQIQRAAEQAAQLVSQLLTFSHKAPLQPTELSLNDVVETTQGLLSPLLGDTIQITLQLDRSVPPVRFDRAQMEQIVADLVLNARDAMPDGGVITIETSAVTLDDAVRQRNPRAEPGAYTRLRVADTGTGMDSNTVARVFEPFFTTKEPGKGIGLGLAMVHGAVTDAGGVITVSSAPGRGTTFELSLPSL